MKEIRTVPFVNFYFQGGHFDLADRMFHSIRDAWLSASRNNMADVKELIPEFFYLPDFLLNANKFDLGTIIIAMSEKFANFCRNIYFNR